MYQKRHPYGGTVGIIFLSLGFLLFLRGINKIFSKVTIIKPENGSWYVEIINKFVEIIVLI